MSKSSDPDHFFQTTDSIAERDRKALKASNKNGSPITLPSKILAIAADPSRPDTVYVAEAAGLARRVNLQTGNKSHIFRGPEAPLTSVAICPRQMAIYCGCWDKTIWSWELESRAPKLRYRGHSDFVKCLLSFHMPSLPVLISGSADSSIIIWNAATATKLHRLTGHSMAVLSLAIDPLSSLEESITLLSASSDRSIRSWKMRVDRESSHIEAPTESREILQHETSVYQIVFSTDDDCDLFTASADGTAKCLARLDGWKEETIFPHGDYVRSVVLSHDDRWLATGGRDEDVKMWNRSTGDLHHVYSGHFDEITGMVLIGSEIVSVGIDATIRKWSFREEAMLNAENEAQAASLEQSATAPAAEVSARSILTTEEEAELAELMDES